MSIKHIEAEALRLTAKERARLAKHLLASLDDQAAAECQEAWADEAERRYKAHKKGAIPSRPASDALGEARSEIK